MFGSKDNAIGEGLCGFPLVKVPLPLFFVKKRIIVVVGLGSSGKTTLCLRLSGQFEELRERQRYNNSDGTSLTNQATIGFCTYDSVIDGYPIQFWELGGSRGNDKYWPYYSSINADSIVYVIDSRNGDKEAIETFGAMKGFCESFPFNEMPLLILLNKCKKEGSRPASDFIKLLKHAGLPKVKLWKMVHCSALSGVGVYENVKWLLNVAD